MSIETALYTTLSTDAGVTAITTRIYPNPAPEGVARPLIDYSMVNGQRLNTMTGVSDAIRKRIQINCQADTYSAAKGLAAAVTAALEGDGYLETEYDLYDPQTQIHIIVVDWSFMAV